MVQKFGFLVDYIIGNVWFNLEEDVILVGDVVKGYVVIIIVVVGVQYLVLQEIWKIVYGVGKGNLQDFKCIGSVYYNFGVFNGIFNVEVICIVQVKFGKCMFIGDEICWGLENFNIDQVCMVVFGVKGLFYFIYVIWDNYEGDGLVVFQ